MFGNLNDRIAENYNSKKLLWRSARLGLELYKKCRRPLIAGSTLLDNLLGREHYSLCHFLWDTVFINEFGDVYPCCHRESGKIGNLYRVPLLDIWQKSSRLKTARWSSLNGCLECFRWCVLLPLKKRENRSRISLALEYPQTIHIQYGTFCNYGCKMCVQDHRSTAVLDNHILEKNVDWSRVNKIILSGGEPLAIEKAKAFYLWLTKQMGKKVSIFTNGLLIDDRWAGYLLKGSKWIYVSVNSATKETYEFVHGRPNFEKVISNIKKLIYLRDKDGTEAKINYNFTIIPENIGEIPEAIRLADQLGCDAISFNFQVAVRDFLNEDQKLHKQTRTRISETLTNPGLKIKVVSAFIEQLGLLEGAPANNIIDSWWD